MIAHVCAALRCALLPMLAVLATTVTVSAAEMPVDVGDAFDNAGPATTGTRMILGLSWQPAFCEGRPNRPECRGLTADDAASQQFSLNGLWLTRQTYCGVSAAMQAQDKSRKWLDLPEVALDEPVRVELARAMPGVASGLDRHEWVKHGSCSGMDAASYYRGSLAMLASVNNSAVGALFKARLGKPLTASEVKSAFDMAFGAGAGERIKMRCRKDGGRQLITGITIGLGGDAGDGFATRIAAAGPTEIGCQEGIVDMAGTQ